MQEAEGVQRKTLFLAPSHLFVHRKSQIRSPCDLQTTLRCTVEKKTADAVFQLVKSSTTVSLFNIDTYFKQQFV